MVGLRCISNSYVQSGHNPAEQNSYIQSGHNPAEQTTNDHGHLKIILKKYTLHPTEGVVHEPDAITGMQGFFKYIYIYIYLALVGFGMVKCSWSYCGSKNHHHLRMPPSRIKQYIAILVPPHHHHLLHPHHQHNFQHRHQVKAYLINNLRSRNPLLITMAVSLFYFESPQPLQKT